MTKHSFSLLSILLLVCVSIVGCGDKGPPLGSVSGTVTLDGEPVEGAFVDFSPLFEGGLELRAAEKTGSDGYFEMQYDLERNGVPLGKYQVQISTQDWEKQEDGSNKVIPEKIPKHYVGIDSILEYEVVDGENVANFELTKKKPK